MDALLPESAKDALDVHKVIGRLVDNGDLLEVHAEWARNLIVGFARIQGVVVGIVANNPAVKAGTLDIDSSDKGARFIRFCNVFNIPLVTLVDIPGFMPGIQQERGGIIRHGAKMLFAYASATVPKITVIMRKAYGGAYLAMCSSRYGSRFCLCLANGGNRRDGRRRRGKNSLQARNRRRQGPQSQGSGTGRPNTATNSARPTKPPARQ